MKVACRKIRSGMAQKFVQTHEELAQLLLRWSGQGFDTYHACSTFKDGSSRTAKNVHLIKSLWADIDTRIGKPEAPYADHLEAAGAVGRFCIDARLPPPCMINSGNGVHIYWVLDEPVTLQEWLPMATGLKSACDQHGLMIDPVRTADAASILRTPGTSNYKKADIS